METQQQALLREERLFSARIFQFESNADWVVLLPGAGAAAAIWRQQVSVLRKRFNLLLLELPGHGRSPSILEGTYSFERVADWIVRAVEAKNVRRAHFVSLSLGSLMAEAVALRRPDMVQSLVLAGGIAGLNSWARFHLRIGNLAKSWVPYMWLYRLFAWIIMPGSVHLHTRHLFYAHAKRLGNLEFVRWFNLSRDVNRLICESSTRQTNIPTLFIMGEHDYMFRRFAGVRMAARMDTQLVVVPDSGHVVSVEKPEQFNLVLLRFLDQQSRH